jgi:UDPglucose--hexose-1-phosphate uridylyltransferase
MTELRQNMVTKEWVIIASERANRPDKYAETDERPLIQDLPAYDPDCPFCVGNEERDLELECFPAEGPWQTRVVMNKYPALSKEGDPVRTYDGVHRQISGVGHHEIVIDHPLHNTTLAFMKPDEIHRLLETFYHRGWNLHRDPRVEHIVYFKNHGKRAGASLPHPHSQIIGLPVVPTDIRQRTEEARRYFDDNGKCVFCKMVEDELKDQIRLVAVSEHFVAFVLYAAPTPFHIWIIPRYHSVSYVYSLPEQLSDLGLVLQDLLRRLYIGLRDPSYNLVIRSSPIKEISNDYFHWYIALVPRLSRTAGFELGSGMHINPSLPEACAEFLRNIKT